MNKTNLNPNDLFHENHLETIENVDMEKSKESENILKVQSIIKKVKAEKPKYKCQQCRVKVLSAQKLEEHIQKKHGPFQCKQCKKIFTAKDDYLNHIKTDHNGVEDTGEVCKDCGKRFVSKLTMKAHIKSKCGKEKKFICTICGQKYMTQISLNAHKIIHKGQKHFCCTYCGKQFISHGEVKVHERKHTKEKPFECNICHKKFSYRESLVTHSSVHTGIKPYLCVPCGKTFSCIGNLIKHRRNKPDSCGLPQYCEETKRMAPRVSTKAAYRNDPPVEPFVPIERFSDPNFAVDEWNETIEIGEFEANWPSEDKNSKNDDSVQSSSDNEIQSETEIKTLKNELDSNEVDNKTITNENTGDCNSNLGDYAMELIDNVGNAPTDEDCRLDSFDTFKIEDIEFVDANQEDSNECFNNTRVKNENFVKNELYECSFCHLELPPNDLKDHMNKVHDVEEIALKEQPPKEEEEENQNQNLTQDPFIQCLYCDESFFLQTEYYKHLKIHSANNHQITSNRDSTDKSNNIAVIKSKSELRSANSMINFICPKCGKECYSRSSLREHERSNCGTLQEHQCNICKKYYYSAGSLKRHITLHTGEMNFLCSVCGQPFSTKGQYVVHMRKHTGEKPYKCNLCQKGFAHRQSLITHITTHTGEKPFICYCGKTFSCVKNLQSHRNTFSNTCGQLPLNTKSAISIGVIKGQLYIGDKNEKLNKTKKL